MKKLSVFIALIAFFGLSLLNAQTREVTGTVTSSEDGMGIPGANVMIKGTTVGTATDIDGKFTISVPESSKVLIFSAMGFQDKEVSVTGKVLSVVLNTSNIALDEVVVVAYGTKTKRAMTGAVTVVDKDIISNQTAISPISAIQGSAPGVNILTSGGQPGESPEIRIRGIGSVNASAEPLIVVDGVVFSGSLASISSNQIETINVLKDASSSALYGSRASNGVILITTKGGAYKEREATISVNIRSGISNPAVDNYKMVGSSDYMKYSWEALKNKQLEDGNTAIAAAQSATDGLITFLGYNPYNVDKPVGVDGEIVDGAKLNWETDWFDALTKKNARYNDYSVSAEGGSDKVSYFVAGNYLNQEGSIIESNFERFSGRANIHAKLKSWLEIGTNTSFSKSIQNYPNQSGTSYTSTLAWVYAVAPIYPLYSRDATGDYKLDENGQKYYDYGNAKGLVNATRPTLSGENAVSSTKLNKILFTRTNFFSSSFMKVKFTKDLSFKSSFGYERYIYDDNQYGHYKYGSAASVNGRVSQERNITETVSITNALSYNKKVGDHSINADIIQETFDYKYDFFNAQATGYLPNVTVLSGSTKPENVGGYLTSERLVSYLGRADYGFKSKYFVDFSYRRDASTRFADGNRWGGFYSVGGSWILSDEDFVKNLTEDITLLKFRSSYGELGNNRGIGYFPYLAVFATGWNNGDNTGVLQGGIVDKNIKWEKTALFNVALDFGFFNNRINGTVEYYSKKSVDLLFDMPLSPSTGNTEVTTNIGTVKNSGFEFMVNTVNIDTKDFTWKSSFNISTNKNELLKLPQEEIVQGTKKWMVGKSVYDFYIQEYAGVDPQTGDALWFVDDADGNKITTNIYQDADKYYQGSSLPDFTGGFSTYLNYKGFDLNAMFSFSFGGQLYDTSYAGLMGSMETAGHSMSTDIENRWQKPGDITDVPRLINKNNDYNATSTRFLFDNNYLRMKAITIGYNLSPTLAKKIYLTNCRFYIQGDNLLTFQSHKGIDPEQSFAGTTDNRSNMMKTVSVGIKVEF